MKRTSKQEMTKIITGIYLDKLEENNIEFLQYEDIGNGQTESFIKDEYIESVENMIDFIWGLDNWIGKWALELYLTAEDDGVDTQSEFGIRKLSNKKGGLLL